MLPFHPQIANEYQISKPTAIEIHSLRMCRFKANQSWFFQCEPHRETKERNDNSSRFSYPPAIT